MNSLRVSGQEVGVAAGTLSEEVRRLDGEHEVGDDRPQLPYQRISRQGLALVGVAFHGNGLDEDFELFAPITWITLLLTPKGRRIVAAAGDQLFEGNNIIGNPLFEKADTLGDLASRHQGSVAVQNDGSALKRIADSSSTSGAALQSASRNIASLCGAPPLSLSPFFAR